MVNLRTYVQRNADSFFVERAGLSNWTSLNVSLGVGYEQDTATYTVVSTPDVSLPAKSAKMRFVADGAKIATLEVGELSGDTQDGSLIIECSAIDPESPLRQTKTREWPFQTIGDLTRAIAADAGLTPAVNAVVDGFLLVPRTQNGVSELAFLQQVCSQNAGRVLVQEGRLIVTLVDQPFASLPTLTIDIIAEGAWVGWRRNWSRGVGQVVASYVEDDGVTVNLVTVGSGTPAKRLPEIYPSRAEAAAGANAHLVAGDVSRDFVRSQPVSRPAPRSCSR